MSGVIRWLRSMIAALAAVLVVAGGALTLASAGYNYDWASVNTSRARSAWTEQDATNERAPAGPDLERLRSSTTLQPQDNATNTGDEVVSGASNTTRTGVVRNNPADWRRTRDVWDNAGLDDILSEANRKAIAAGRSPVVDESWIKHFPGDEALLGERISPHHLGGGPITAPLPATRHLDAHMPGGFRYNPGGPGATG